jgi:hypothetical protein
MDIMRNVKYAMFVCTLSVLFVATGWGQDLNAVISGTVTDQTGAVIPNAQLALTAVDTQITVHSTTGPDGLYSFPNLQAGAYELRVSASGFEDFVQTGIMANINDKITLPVSLHLGAATQTIEVTANASPLNYDNAEVKGTMTPQVIDALPLLMQGGQRSAATFVTLLPGVNIGPGGSTDSQGMLITRINGHQLMSDEATLDGVSMVEGLASQTGLVSIHADFPISPEAVDEIGTLTSNFDVSYGASASAITTAVTKSGTSEFHGGAYEYNRNTDFNARSFGVATRPVDIENDGGGYIGGPFKVPLWWSNRKKTYFFVNNEEYRSKGATTKTFLTVPSMAMRTGDFSAWPNPIYDPDTLAVNPGYNPSLPTSASNLPYTRQQFMGCNGTTPNVVCASDPRLAASLAQDWLKFVPPPTNTALANNYEPPTALALVLNANTDQWDVRVDQYIRDKDHVMVTWHYRGSLPFREALFPPVIDTTQTRIPNWSNIVRINYDHTFSPTLLNHFAGGYLNLESGSANASDCCINQVPHIPGVWYTNHEPALTFSEYSGYGSNGDFESDRPAWIFNDMVTWVRGKHLLKIGGEFRRTATRQIGTANGTGTYTFNDSSTGLVGIPSGNSMASFLLGDVGTATAAFYTMLGWSAKAVAYGTFVGDTWKVTPKLTISPGLRYDIAPPDVEFRNHRSFLDPNGPNPGAGNLPGRLVFAGTGWGAASWGARHPETTWFGAVAPRLSLAYALRPKTVVRAGYGIFYEQNYYAWGGGGMSTDGFSISQTFSSTGLGGLTPAFLLQNGFPTNFVHPPVIQTTFDNGKNAPYYLEVNGDHLSYSQQWNLAVQQQVTQNFSVEAMYLGNKGTRLTAATSGINALNPSFLSMGSHLRDVFTPGMTSLDGVNAPYAGWAAQMVSCQPTVAQALLRYPQYCGSITPVTEKDGNSTYHSLQIKAENRFAHGFYLLGSYTLSKTLDDTDDAQAGGSYAGPGELSPYERKRWKALALTDIPNLATISLAYDLPFGAGKRFVNTGGPLSKVVGGWRSSGIIRIQEGVPFAFSSTTFCNVPSQFSTTCIPPTPANPWAQGASSFNPALPLFNRAAFEPASDFNFYFGDGPRVSNVRAFGYHNLDFSLQKDTKITERVSLQIRFGAFNIFNFHIFSNNGAVIGGGGSPMPINTDISSPTFGMWTGGVTPPRNCQVGMKLIF